MTLRLALRCLAAATLLAGAALAQVPPHNPASAPRIVAKGAKTPVGPLWRELAPGQQKALAPLAAQWETLNEAQKRKWIALSANYPKMSGEEQAKLHSRMTEWVNLSPQQRTIARLNYGETRKLTPDDRKAKWEAYQALSPEEKKKLAAGSTQPKPPVTAAAVRPVPKEKLATLPRSRPSHVDAKTPRIAAAPNQVDHNTLLPHAAQPAETPTPARAPQPEPSAAQPQAGTPD